MASVVKPISGGGGGKGGGGGGGISESADTLSGVVRARSLTLVSEGRIDGLVDGERSIYLDGVPLRDLSGTPNYKPFKWKMVNGTPDQLPIPGFQGTGTEVAVNVPLTVSAGQITRVITDNDADAVRINLSVSGLSKTSDKGKVGPTTVTYKILGKRGTGAWISLKDGLIDGKTGARYPKSEEVLIAGIPGIGGVSIGVLRTTPDSASVLLVNGLSWDSFTVINYEQYAYPHSAIFGLEIDARYFSAIPTLTLHLRGLWIKVPSNYNPVTRVYTGIWDGTFVWAYSNNPAWCFYDLVTSPRYGLGRRISAGQINKWELYLIGKYCDELVPTGLSTNISDIISSSGVSATGQTIAGVPLRRGPTERRFTLNCVINTADDAYKVLSQLTSVFRGMAYWGSSGISFTQDRPGPLAMVWNNANVIDGKFSYQGSSRATRRTVVSVGWNDPSEDFRHRFEYVEDRDGIKRYGVRSTEITTFGCTSRSQARRIGLWMLYTERMESDAITFAASFDSSQVMPGDIGQIMDVRKVGARWGGRLVACTLTTATVDAPVTLTAGSYTFTLVAKDGTTVLRTVVIAAPGTFSEFTFSTALAALPVAQAVWVLSSAVVTPVYVRVVGKRETAPNVFEITALRHNPGKNRAVDEGAPLEIPRTSLLKVGELPAITNLVAVESVYLVEATQLSTINLDISWDASLDPSIRGYVLTVVGNQGFALSPPELRASAYTMSPVEPATYTITVVSVSALGLAGSNPTVITVVVTGTGARVVLDGHDGISVTLNNEAHTVAATFEGVVLSFGGADSYITLGTGGMDKTSEWAFTKTDVNVSSFFEDGVPNHVVIDAVTPTKLLIHSSEAEGSYLPIDSSMSNHTIINPGTVVSEAALHAKFDRALKFSNAEYSYLELRHNTEFELRAQDFAIQMQVYVPTLLGTRQFLMGWWGPTADTHDHSWALLVGTDGTLQFDYASLLDVADFTVASTATIPTGVVTEVAVGRKGNVLTLKVGTTLKSVAFDKTIRTIAGDIEPPLPPVVTLVSPLYPIESVDAMDVTHSLVRGSSQGVVSDSLDVTHRLVSGILSSVLQSYINWPSEQMDMSHSLIAGALIQVLKTYSLWLPEELDFSHNLTAGSLLTVLVSYNNFAAESIDMTHALTSGALT